MPKIYRAMREQDGFPAVHSGADGLGARQDIDIPVDAVGQVRPEQGGLSVAPSMRDLSVHRIPKRLRAVVPGARGSDNLCIWRHGAGDFEAGPVTADLTLRLDPQNARHGFVEPSQATTLANYQAALAATRDQWQKEEP